MKLLFGIGNPGQEYAGTRHNVGLAFVDFAQKSNLHGMILAKSDVFVNLSGSQVKKLKTKHKLKHDSIIVVHDDLDIEFGKFKVSFARNSAGHRGVQSVIDTLKTNEFWRLRLGIANKKLAAMRASGSVADFVLSKFATAERARLETIFDEALHHLRDRLNLD